MHQRWRALGLAWILALCGALAPGAADAADADGGDDDELPLDILRTADLDLVYFRSLGYLTPHAIRTFTNSLAWQRRVLGWRPSQPVAVFLKDFADFGGGSASVAPTNSLWLDVAPPSLAFETFPPSERLYALMNHELVHVAMGDMGTGSDRGWRRVFGGKVAVQSRNPETLLYSWLTVPRYTVPRWYLEGSAVFLETWMGGGLGRAQGGYDEMVFRAMVQAGARFHDPLALASRGVLVDFQVGANAYLYGTRFFTWLAHAWSPERVIDWLRRDEGSHRHYATDFERVFGLPLDAAWQRWIAFEHDFQRANLARVRAHPITPHRLLEGAALGSISRTWYDEASGVLYGAFRTPGVQEHVGALDTRDGSYRRLADIKRAMLYRVASFAYDAEHGTAFFTDDNLGWRDLIALDVKTGARRTLLQDGRIGDIAVNRADRSLWGVRHADGLATLVRIPYPYERWTAVHTFPYGMVPSDLDISPDGRLLSASVTEASADQFVRVWPIDGLLAGSVAPLSQFGFGQSVPESFVFSPDGRFLYGSSYYTGVSNILRYEVASGAVETVSNAETGYFRPTPLADGRLVVLHYTAEGFVPAIIDPKPLADVSAISFLGAELAAKHSVVTTWQVPPPSTVDDEALVIQRGPYRALERLAPRSAYPVLQGYKSTVGLGWRFDFEDPLRLASISVTAALTPGAGDLPGEQRGHVDIAARYLGWRAGLAWNKSDFYDLFGPTKRSRKGYAVTLGRDRVLIFDEPQRLDWRSDVAWYDRIDTLPQAQNVGSRGFDRLARAETGLHYSDLRRSLGAVDDESGIAWRGVLAASRAGTQGSLQLHGGFDIGIAFDGHSSLWSRTAFGVGAGAQGDPVANFYFGGFGNNVVDNGKAKRYRDAGSLPGFDIDAVAARRFAKQTFEWNLPPAVFESLGRPGLHLSWLRPALFATALWADPPAGGAAAPATAAAPRRHASIGGQIDLRFSVLHWYEMLLSAGYAKGYDGGRRRSDEWMLSLKIL